MKFISCINGLEGIQPIFWINLWFKNILLLYQQKNVCLKNIWIVCEIIVFIRNSNKTEFLAKLSSIVNGSQT